jgi:hypothetical protein
MPETQGQYISSADFTQAPAITHITSNLSVTRTSGNANTWIDFPSGSITIAGNVGEYYLVQHQCVYSPGNTAFNHIKWTAVNGCTVSVDGQSGYYATTAYLTIFAIVQLLATSATVKLQDFSSGTTGTNSLLAGSGGAAAAGMDIVVIKLF